MRFLNSKVVCTFLIGLCFFFGGEAALAQSIEKRVIPISEELFPLLSKEDCSDFIKNAQQGKEIKDFLGATLKIEVVTNQYLRILSDSGIVDELILLPHRKGEVLCHIRTLEVSSPISFISFYNDRGEQLTQEEFLPSIDGFHFLSPSVDRSSLSFKMIEQLLPYLPMYGTFVEADMSLTLYPSYVSIATEEQKMILQQLLRSEPITLKWKKKGFVLEQ